MLDEDGFVGRDWLGRGNGLEREMGWRGRSVGDRDTLGLRSVGEAEGWGRRLVGKGEGFDVGDWLWSEKG